MPTSDPGRVFISYARKDGAQLAQRLQGDLRSSGYEAWLDTKRISGSSSWTKEIETALDQSDYVLALLTPGSYVSEICRAEQMRALRKGKLVIPLLAQRGTEIPIHLEAKDYCDFTTDSNYAQIFAQLLQDLHKDVGLKKGPRQSYVTVPPLPLNYVERPEALRALRDTLFAEDLRQPIEVTSIVGMGGVGKTVLAQALCYDEVVQQAFPDGIVWITAGRERKRNFIEDIREVAKALGDDLARYDNELAARNQYRNTISTKAALIVVDDVWSKADIEPLLAESSRSRLLFTTRDASIGRFIGAREYTADLLDYEKSRELLAAWARLEVTALPVEADKLIGECGRLPLALSVVGAMLRGAGPKSWSDTLDLLHKADLSAVEELLPKGQDSIFRAVDVSLQALTPLMRERYQALAVLPEDTAVPDAALRTFWGLDGQSAVKTADQLVSRSLAARNDSGRLILHNLQLDYLRGRASDLPELHNRLLEQYKQERPEGWHMGPNDGYFFQNLAYHLWAASRIGELGELLLDFEWLQAKLDATDVTALLNDFDLVSEDRDLMLVRDAIRLSAHVLDQHKIHLAGQLIGRLLSFSSSRIQALLQTAPKCLNGVWLRPLTQSLTPPATGLIRTIALRQAAPLALSRDS